MMGKEYCKLGGIGNTNIYIVARGGKAVGDI
jgi:hypothetical protein